MQTSPRYNYKRYYKGLHSIPYFTWWLFVFVSGGIVFGTWCTTTCRQRINAIVLMPYDLFSWNKRDIRFLQYYAWFTLQKIHLGKIAHSLTVRTSPSSSYPTCLFLFFLLHVSPALAEHWLLIFPASWGAGPSLAPLPQADPISLRSQASPALKSGTNSIRIKLIE